MTTVINTNIASQIAQNNLLNNQAAVTNAITQLSSGLAINSAADNPAGLAIATTLQAQINGQTVAQQNANNGISLAQTGQSALTQITNNLQTIRQLAVQASNASNTAANRAALNQEVQQSLAQINTIATTTSFNGQNLLDGSFGTQNFQIGANAGQSIGVNLTQGAQTNQIGKVSSTTFSLQGLANGGLSTEALNISVGGGAPITIANSVAGTTAGQTSDSAYAAAAAINSSNIQGLTASATNSQTFTFSNVQNGGAAAENYNLSINGTNVFGTSGLSVANGQSVSAATVLNAINSQSSTTGVTATLGSDGKTFTLAAADGSNIQVAQGTSGANIAGGLDNTQQKINSAAANGSLQALTAGVITSSTSNQLYGSVTLSSASLVSLSGVGAQDISGQYDNTTNSADSLQASQTVAASAAFNAGTSGTINFNLGGAVAATASINTTATDTATTVAQKINSTAALQQAGISASLNAQGNLVVSNSSGQNLAITDSAAVGGFASGLDNAQIVNGAAFTAGVAGDTLKLTVGSTAVTLTLAGATSAAQLSTLIDNNSALRAAGITSAVSAGKLVVTNTSGQALTAADTGTLVSGLAVPTSTVGTFAGVTDQTKYNATASGSLANIDVLTVADSQHTIQAVDAALSQISTLQGQLGAVQNRFTSVISNLSSSVQNAQSTQSSIQDTNYASETSALSRAQVLSQAAQAMVAQANQLPQQVLKLLQ